MPFPRSMGVVFVRTAAGYSYVEESRDEAGKSACLNTTDIMKLQGWWKQISTVARARARMSVLYPTAVALPPFLELLRPWASNILIKKCVQY